VVKYRSSVFPDEGSDQVLALELSNRLNLYEYIRLALGSRARPASTFGSAMSFDCEFE
jgi:hypothetical protein